MRNFIVLFVAGLSAVAALPADQQRIVGGSVTTIDQYPTIVALLFSWSGTIFSQACGGTILNTRSILTAAHCPYGDPVSRWRVRIGSTWASSGGKVHTFGSINIHPYYNPRTMDSDIAIMRITSPITYSSVAQAASIAGPNYIVGDDQPVWAVGWGTVSSGGPVSEQLRHVQIWTVNQLMCSHRYSTGGGTITDNMLCSGWLDVGGRDQCQGDSGGPLYHNGIVIGVCSWGFGCARPEYPGINTRVSRFTTWIQSNA